MVLVVVVPNGLVVGLWVEMHFLIFNRNTNRFRYWYLSGNKENNTSIGSPLVTKETMINRTMVIAMLKPNDSSSPRPKAREPKPEPSNPKPKTQETQDLLLPPPLLKNTFAIHCANLT